MYVPARENKQPNVYVPAREEFDDKEWIDAIWNLVSKAGWKKKNGEAPNHWHSLVSAYNGVLTTYLKLRLVVRHTSFSKMGKF